jgi:hypothetical protein
VVVVVLAVAAHFPVPAEANGGPSPGGEGYGCFPGEIRPLPLAGTGVHGMSSSPIVEGYATLMSGGDLDADGRDEAIERLELYTEDRALTRLTALDGPDGRALWSRVFEGSIELVTVGDLDGTPGDDILIFQFTYEEVPGAFRTTTIVSGVRGADGGQLWTRRFEGLNTGASVGPSGGFVDFGSSYPIGLAHDADGDGTVDLLVARHNGAFVYDSGTQTNRGHDSAIFELLSGRTGAPISLFSVPDPFSFVDATTVPDLTGDGLDDVVLVSTPATEGEEDGRTVATLTAYSGRGIPAWRKEIVAFEYPFVRALLLDGGKISDILVRSATFDHETGESGFTRIEALSGTDGSSIWALNVPGRAEPVAAGDAVKDGGDDLLVLRCGDHPKARESAGRSGVSLLNGANGRTIWARDLSSPQAVEDANRDGVMDVLVNRVEGHGKKARPFTDMLSGATGKRVWTSGRGRSQFLSPLGGDLNGDRAHDLALFGHLKGKTNYVAIDGRTGRSLWAKPAQPEGYLASFDTAALRERGRADILESAIREEGDRSILLGARSGKDGRLLWRRTIDLRDRPVPKRAP